MKINIVVYAESLDVTPEVPRGKRELYIGLNKVDSTLLLNELVNELGTQEILNNLDFMEILQYVNTEDDNE